MFQYDFYLVWSSPVLFHPTFSSCRFCRLFHSDVEDKISMNMLLYDHHDDNFDIVRRKAAGLVLKSMDFEGGGL